jgi:hypothetical protein
VGSGLVSTEKGERDISVFLIGTEARRIGGAMSYQVTQRSCDLHLTLRQRLTFNTIMFHHVLRTYPMSACITCHRVPQHNPGPLRKTM